MEDINNIVLNYLLIKRTRRERYKVAYQRQPRGIMLR